MITFANGKSYEQKNVIGEVQSFQGQLRNTIAIKFPTSNITMAEATEIYKDAEALKEISISEVYTETTLDADGNPVTVEKTRGCVKLNFTLPVDLSLSTEQVSPGETAEVIIMRLAQMSALELALASQATDIAAMEAAIMEIGEIIGGEG